MDAGRKRPDDRLPAAAAQCFYGVAVILRLVPGPIVQHHSRLKLEVIFQLIAEVVNLDAALDVHQFAFPGAPCHGQKDGIVGIDPLGRGVYPTAHRR